MKFSKYESVLLEDGFQRFELDSQLFLVKLIDDGVYEMIPHWRSKIEEVAEVVVDCLNGDFNFFDFIWNGFRLHNFNYRLECIHLVFNGVDFFINYENADIETIINLYNYEKEMKQKQKQQRREAAVREKFYAIQNTSQIEFKDNESRQQWEQYSEFGSQNYYYRNILKYSEYWAKFMQYLMLKDDKPLHLIAKNAGEIADVPDVGGLTGNIYNEAVVILSECWKYGEELRVWYNKSKRYDGEGVVNAVSFRVALD